MSREVQEEPEALQIPEEYRDVVEKAAKRIADSHMEGIVVFFLESFRPMAFFWSQMLRLYIAPFLLFLGVDRVEKLLAFLERDENLEYFIRRIEFYAEKKSRGGKRKWF